MHLNNNGLYRSIFDINSETAFNEKALELFKFQFEENPVYRSFCDLLYIHPSDVQKLEDIPFLPIEFFKTHKVVSSKKEIQQTFTSSGTTGNVISQHHVADLNLYKASFQKGFAKFYGNIRRLYHFGSSPLLFGTRRVIFDIYGRGYDSRI